MVTTWNAFRVHYCEHCAEDDGPNFAFKMALIRGAQRPCVGFTLAYS